jgi:uncharacterized membrane protein
VRGENVKLHTRDLALTAIFAALYAVLVLALAGISFQLIQVRVADALIPLSMLFGWPVALGVTIGGAVANFASPMPSVLVDVTLGSLANLIASLLAGRIGRWKAVSRSASEFFGCLAATLVVTIIVGSYLAVLTETDLWVWWLGIGVGSLVSICMLGYALVQVMRRIQTSQSAT